MFWFICSAGIKFEYHMCCFCHLFTTFLINANCKTIKIVYFVFHCLKSVHIRSYSGPHFPEFRLNKERNSVSLHIQSEYGKMRTRIPLNTDTFYAVYTCRCWSLFSTISFPSQVLHLHDEMMEKCSQKFLSYKAVFLGLNRLIQIATKL